MLRRILMNVTNCVNAGVYSSMADDWLSALQTTGLCIVLTSFGAGIGIAHVIEKKMQRQVHVIENAIVAAAPIDPSRQQLENSLNLMRETLVKIRRYKCFMFGFTAACSVGITWMYAKKGCPGFDYWSEVRSQYKSLFPSTNTLPVLQREEM